MTPNYLPPISPPRALFLFALGYLALPYMIMILTVYFFPHLSHPMAALIQLVATLISWIVIFCCAPELIRPSHGWQRADHPIFSTISLLIILFMTAVFTNKIWQTMGWPHVAYNPYQGLASSWRWVIAISAITWGPLVEEIVFRGLIQSSLKPSLGIMGSILATAFIFTFSHGTYQLNLEALLAVFLFSLCLSIWRERTESILPSMFAHMCYNAVVVINLAPFIA